MLRDVVADTLPPPPPPLPIPSSFASHNEYSGFGVIALLILIASEVDCIMVLVLGPTGYKVVARLNRARKRAPL